VERAKKKAGTFRLLYAQSKPMKQPRPVGGSKKKKGEEAIKRKGAEGIKVSTKDQEGWGRKWSKGVLRKESAQLEGSGTNNHHAGFRCLTSERRKNSVWGQQGGSKKVAEHDQRMQRLEG